MIALRLFVLSIIALVTMILTFVGWKVNQVLTLVIAAARLKTTKSLKILTKKDPLPINFMNSAK
jgi:hypothetical protein